MKDPKLSEPSTSTEDLNTMKNDDNHSKSGKARAAKEVFIFMHRNFRASRNNRAHWFFHHLGKTIRIESKGLMEKDENDDGYSQEMNIVGILPENADEREVLAENEEFLVTENTKVTYISRYYRHVYILDLSPSTIVADCISDDCLCSRTLPILEQSMTSAVRPFTIPGTSRVFNPQVYLSVNVFVPFLKFEHELTLIQGVLLTESNVAVVFDIIRQKYEELFKALYNFSKPILHEWGKLKRRYKNYKFESFCDTDSICDDYMDDVQILDYSYLKNQKRKKLSPLEDKEVKGHGEIMKSVMQWKRGIWQVTPELPENNQVFSGDGGYIMPEWALIFMLRIGLISTQMLPENTQSNVIIITDSVCGMPDEKALQHLLTQIRSYTIAVSVIQLQQQACSEPVFGHVGSYELFHFLTTATFGTYLPNKKQNSMDGIWGMDRNDTILEDNSNENLNAFHRALICWSFENALAVDKFMENTFSEINLEFVELQQRGVERHRRFLTSYEATLNQLMYVRLREGFTLAAAKILPETSNILITLSLAFRPSVFIEYIITCPWPTEKNYRQKIQVELVIQAPYHELKDLLVEGQYLEPERLNLTKSAIDSIIEADRLLLHIHAFNTQPSFFTIPAGVTIDYALFSSYDKNVRKLPPICMGKNEDNSTRSFIGFWRNILELNDLKWQKWVHTHTERVILTVPKMDFRVFNEHVCLELDCSQSLSKLHAYVKTQSSFCLVNGNTYVTLVYDDPKSSAPTCFFMRRISSEAPTIILKTAFLGGLNSGVRRKVVEADRECLLNLTIRDRKYVSAVKKRARLDSDMDNVLSLIRRPLERMLIRYTDLPADLRQIVRVKEVTTDEDEIKLITLHNALSKCLSCRRTIMIVSAHNKEGGAALARPLTDYIMNVIIQRRILDESFKPAWSYNNILSLCRQVYNSSGTSLEQFIMFPSTTLAGTEKKPVMRRAPTAVRTVNQPNSVPPKKSLRALAVVCEFWFEPESAGQLENCDNLRMKNVETRQWDDVLLASIIYTFDRIIRLCGDCIEFFYSDDGMESPPAEPEENEADFLSKKYYCCRSVDISNFSNSTLMNYNAEGIQKNQISPFVTIFSCIFSVKNLLKTAEKKVIYVNHFVKAEEDITLCYQLILRYVHCQLREFSDVTWLLDDEDNRFILGSYIDKSLLNNGLKFRLYAKGMSPWSMGIVLVPMLNMWDFDEQGIPIMMMVCNETQLAYCGAKRQYDSNGVVNVDVKDIKAPWISECRIGWRPRNPVNIAETVNAGFISFVDDDLMARARMSAIFEAAKKGLEVDEERVCEMAIDVDFFEFEMESIPQALTFLCRHLRCDGSKVPTTDLCSNDTNINEIFAHALSQNFKLVPGTENIFFVNDKNTKQPRKRKRQQKKAAQARSLERIQGSGDENEESKKSKKKKKGNQRPPEPKKLWKWVDNGEETVPCFIQFNCSVLFNDKERTMDTFPINFLPSCIHQVLQKCTKFPVGEYDVRTIEVGLDVLVMTNKERSDSHFDIFALKHSKKAYKNPVEYYRKAMVTRYKNRNEDSESSQSGFLRGLRSKEKGLVTDLLKSVSVMLEMEQNLIDARKGGMTKERLMHVIKYIDKAVLSSTQVGYMERREKSLGLVIRTQKAADMLMKSLKNTSFDYLKLKKCPKTSIFYCCRVEDVEKYKEFEIPMAGIIIGDENDGEEEWNVNTAFGEDQLSDFWIILKIDTVITLHFCQRYEKRHSSAVDTLWRMVRQKLRVVNQRLLLERMYETRECDQLVISAEDTFDSSETVKTQRSRVSESTSPIDDGMRYEVAPGYFACNLQRELWFYVPQRLREMSLRQRKPALAYAFEKLRNSLQEHGVRNIPNTYIVRDDQLDRFMYMQLHMTKESYEQSIKNTRIQLKKRHLSDVEKRMETDISMTCFALEPPAERICDILTKILNDKLDHLLMTEMMRGFLQNREMPLYASEIRHLQPVGQDPFGRSFFGIPTIFGQYLSSFVYYINQHIGILNNLTPAKVKEEMAGGSKNASFSSATMLANLAENNQIRHEETKFSPQRPVSGELPLNYDMSSFYFYLKLATAGVTSTGIGVIEFRIVKPDGTVFESFPQPRMNEQSHKQLVPNVPDADKAMVYRDIIKAQKVEWPKECLDKTICGYLELNVWKQGEVEMMEINDIMAELIEMSMYDVITEFGYLNTPLLETASNNSGTLPFFQSSEISDITIYASDANFFIPTGPIPPTAYSVDGRLENIESNHRFRRSFHGGSIDFAGTTKTVAKLNALGNGIAEIAFDHSQKKPNFINRKTAYGIMKWFDLIASKSGNTNTVVKDTIRFECQHAILTPLFEIKNRIETELGLSVTSSETENVFLCGLKRDGDSQHGSIRESNCSIFGGANSSNEGKFEVLTTDPFVEMKEDLGVDETMGSPNEYLIVCFMKNVFAEIGENEKLAESRVNELIMLFRNHLHGRYEPHIESETFCPRQRAMFAMMKGEVMTVYYYNFHPNILKEVQRKIQKIAAWHNAKTKLLREIGLHKMGITHMSTLEHCSSASISTTSLASNSDKEKDFNYEKLIWTDPGQLIVKQYPPEFVNVPAIFDSPEYSNIFYRMYRQPDLQFFMGRSNLVYKSDCIPTNHFEQLIRWRDGLKKRLNTLKKITNAHDELLKGKTEMKEDMLYEFLRPPKITKKTESAAQISLHEEDDGGSLTEKNSKRLSVQGDTSIRSVVQAESDLFRQKGEFVKKVVEKRKPVAKLIDEIRCPLFALESWRKIVKEREAQKIVDSVKDNKSNETIFERGSSVAEWNEKVDDETVEVIPIEKTTPSKGSLLHRLRTESQSATEMGKMMEEMPSTSAIDPAMIEIEEPASRMVTPPPTHQPVGAIARAKAMTLRLVRPFRKLSNRESKEESKREEIVVVEDAEDSMSLIKPAKVPSEVEEFEPETDPSDTPILYRHAQHLAKYFEKNVGYKRLTVITNTRRTAQYNRYKITMKADSDEKPYVLFFKSFDGGIVFLELTYDVPEFIVKIYVYTRADHSTADFYMKERMKKLYLKETEELNDEVNKVKQLNMSRFNYEFHMTVITEHLAAKVKKETSIYGEHFNFLQLLKYTLKRFPRNERRSKNVVIERVSFYYTKSINDEFWNKYEDPKDVPCRILRMQNVRYDKDSEGHNLAKANWEHMLVEVDVSEMEREDVICHMIMCKARDEDFEPTNLTFFTIKLCQEDSEASKKMKIVNPDTTEDDEGTDEEENLRKERKLSLKSWWTNSSEKFKPKIDQEKKNKKIKWKDREMKKTQGKRKLSLQGGTSTGEADGQ